MKKQGPGKSISEKQKEEEKVVMTSFAEVCPIGIRKESIKNRQPPEPDIRCVTEQGEEIAFELVDLSNPSIHSYANNYRPIMDSLDEEYARRSDKLSVLNDAHIRISCCNQRLRNRKNIKILFDWLETQPLALSGDLPHYNNPEINDLIMNLHMEHEPGFNGPRFNLTGVGGLCDPLFEALRKKFKKTYGSNLPVELLAYYRLSRPYKVIDYKIEELEAFITTQGASSKFRRVWIFDYSERKILYPRFSE
ncbi:MAG TPA: hypothetical protein VM658_04700 [bacterium]|nr:hypothetical protein [bacterium]